ncbi:MAG: AbrB/MazE/SpoVT family DNA-binding domain-containing protein [Methanoregula sp.]|nr:AbrB/MazE/SpoVT family DNA-binding domain-containing protein [Methanoregula sp.]MDD5186640.1 AbrB/MazE/SpoVT family DNA-binding domain-containing protein [Methanoregula sp.]
MPRVRQLGEKGQIVIPKDIRDYFGLKKGSSISIELDQEKIIMMPKKDDDFMNKWNNIVKKKLSKKIDIKRQIEEEIEERHRI